MTIRAFDDAGTTFDQANINLDGCLLADFDDATAAFDEPLIDFDGCDNRTGTVTPPTPSPATVPASGRDEIHPETRRYWESERIRLRVLRDDDEVLVLL